ncbi:DUF4304 domain-containing protein [Pseudomonas aegrilactucae]|uniref:DUF4304 domain-containing protein n=1 Tax=Pseudomonas aegrilactucae TaxID=2854028 RepID=A0A9Q2XMF1_9PSED|nr:DUF4304 domain-containing protein [Pseudomonas aegrilactucae]MBV6288839.1 DUF4304 domain-containing protein [Pseudomonas aegrilactucae]
MSKVLTTNKVFSSAATEVGFLGSGSTRYIEYPDFFLLLNHQKSSYSKAFYVNVGIIYKELMGGSPSIEEVCSAFNFRDSKLSVHVDFRLEGFPDAPVKLQKTFDDLVVNGDMGELKRLLIDVFSRLIEFVGKNHDRATIRRLRDEKKLSAMVLKEV